MKSFPRNLLMIVTAAILLVPTAKADGFRGGPGGGGPQQGGGQQGGGRGGPGQGGPQQGGGQQGGGGFNGGHDDRGGRDGHDGRGDNRGGDWGRGGHGGGWGNGPGRGGWNGPGFGGPGFGGPGRGVPPPRPIQQQIIVNCGSGDYRLNRCFVAGNIVNAQIARQESQSACILGRTFGYEGNSVWVDQGCRADFVVYLQN